jgi:hypothetical protein
MHNRDKMFSLTKGSNPTPVRRKALQMTAKSNESGTQAQAKHVNKRGNAVGKSTWIFSTSAYILDVSFWILSLLEGNLDMSTDYYMIYIFVTMIH